MLIKDFLTMSVTFGGIYCAIVNSENYTLLSGCEKDEKRGVLFQGRSSNIQVELLNRKFLKWDMFGNEFIFITQ